MYKQKLSVNSIGQCQEEIDNANCTVTIVCERET